MVRPEAHPRKKRRLYRVRQKAAQEALVRIVRENDNIRDTQAEEGTSGDSKRTTMNTEKHEHDFKFSHYEDVINPSSTSAINQKTVITICKTCGEYRKQIIETWTVTSSFYSQ